MKKSRHLFSRWIGILLLFTTFLWATGCGGGGKLVSGGKTYGSVSLSVKAAAQSNEVAYYLIDIYEYDTDTETPGTDPVVPTTRVEADRTSVAIPDVPVGVKLLWIRGFNDHDEVLTHCKKVITVTAGVNSAIEAVMKPVNPVDPVPEPNTVRGTVVDVDGHPIENAQVSLVGVTTVNTGVAGDFIFNNVDDGTYTLEITAGGYRSFTDSLTVSGGETHTMSATLDHESRLLAKRCVGGILNDYGRTVIPTSDGGVLLVGQTQSPNNPPEIQNHTAGNNLDVWVVKLDSFGAPEWSNCYGLGATDQEAGHAIETSDGCYMIIGTSDNGVDTDIYALKIASDGSLIWQDTLGGTGNDRGTDVIELTPSRYILAGTVIGAGGDIGLASLGAQDLWLVDITLLSGTDFTKNDEQRLGGLDNESEARLLKLTGGAGGYMVAGSTLSSELPAKHTGTYSNDIYLARLNSDLSLDWQKCYGGDSTDMIASVSLNGDGSILVAGSTASDPNTFPGGDISTTAGFHGFEDIWLFTFQPSAASNPILWQKCLGGSMTDECSGAKVLADGTILVFGGTYSSELPFYHDQLDMYIARLDANRELTWERCYGGSDMDYPGFCTLSSDGNLVSVGSTYSSAAADNDIGNKYFGGASNTDMWFFKLLGPGL